MPSLDDRILRTMRDVFPDFDGPLRDDLTAADIPGWDSTNHVLFLFDLEAEFGIEFVGDEAAALADIGELKRVLRAKGCE